MTSDFVPAVGATGDGRATGVVVVAAGLLAETASATGVFFRESDTTILQRFRVSSKFAVAAVVMVTIEVAIAAGEAVAANETEVE